MLFLHSLPQIWKIETKKNWRIKVKTHLKFDFRFWLNWVLYCQLLQCYVWYRKFCFGLKSSGKHQNLSFETICSHLWSFWGPLLSKSCKVKWSRKEWTYSPFCCEGLKNIGWVCFLRTNFLFYVINSPTLWCCSTT